MQTAVISYRVADFLKQHPPFQSMEEADLVGLAARGRVKFHEPDEYIYWQGTPHAPNVFVIQQGTVAIWDEGSGAGQLRDIRGAGDMLGVECFAGATSYLYSAKSTSDVVIYAFPAADFGPLVERYPEAARYLAAHASVSSEYQAPDQRPDADQLFLYDVARLKAFATCTPSTKLQDAVREMRAKGLRAIAVVTDQEEVAGVLTVEHLMQWIAEGGGSGSTPVSGLLKSFANSPGDDEANVNVPSSAHLAALCTFPPETHVSECVLGMSSSGASATVITERGTRTGPVLGVITGRDLAASFGEQPSVLLEEIRDAGGMAALASLNQRVRAFVLENLHRPSSVDWLARFTSIADSNIFRRVLDLTAASKGANCWCLCGSSGREEELTQRAPLPVLISDAGAIALQDYGRVREALMECGYLPHPAPFDESFWSAGIKEWSKRFDDWMRDPIENQIYLARPLFDLRPVAGDAAPWRALSEHAAGLVTREFLFLLANDCLGNLPPLTFFQDAVVHESGEQSSVFELERTALQPLVDVGRVFGLAAARQLPASAKKGVLGGSTLERFALAKAMLPEQEPIFREASETMRVVLYQKGRVGIRRHSDGSELPPNLLSRHDRQVLKTGFRSIFRMLEYTAECEWLPRN